jgi:cysteine desulfurase
MDPIYLDYNATTPVDPQVAQAMEPYITKHFGNPSSSHIYGFDAKKAVEKARKQVANLLGCEIDEIIFTSGGSESNNFAIKGVAGAYRDKGNHIITSTIEHPAVIEVCHYLETQGYKISYLPVDKKGRVDPRQVEEAITPYTILITIMHANNEVGTIQPIEEIAEIAHRFKVLFHSDCAQSIGKIAVDVKSLKVDLLSIAGHKLYAPKGIGALYIRSGVKLEKLIHGANHEMNWRAGTENVIECVGLGEACELVSKNLFEEQKYLEKLRNRFETQLIQNFPEIKINGDNKYRLPNTLSVSFPQLEANTIIGELSQVAVSAGAACHSDRIDVSHVLKAMELPLEYAMGTIRFSVGRFSTIDEIDKAVEEISRVIRKLKPTGMSKPITSSGEIKLTQYTHGLGCACKLRPQLLEEVLRKLPLPSDSNILVGTETGDDAAVYRINDNMAVIQTVDFFTPIVDDPFFFGTIAAANSLSDIYAMGGKPLFALNIVGFPSNRLPLEVLENILKGAQTKAQEAGISIIGGHTVDDTEPKFGLAVCGIIHPKKIFTNSKAQVGDCLILTKPIGTGILSTGLKRGMLDSAQQDTLIETMGTLNKDAAEVMEQRGATACTDITGFGLLGHLLGLMKGSGTSAKIYYEKIPLLPGVKDFAVAGIIPGGTLDNYEYTKPFVQYSEKLSKSSRLIINDAQTSGGLLISVPREICPEMISQLHSRGVMEATSIGEVISENSIKIKIK